MPFNKITVNLNTLFSNYNFLLKQLYIQLTGSLATKSKPNIASYDMIILNKKISLCNFVAQENFVVKWMISIQRQYANFDLKCPFPTGNHTMKKFPVDTSIFPPIFPDMPFRLYFFMSAQVPGLTSTKEMYNVICTGHFKRS